MVRRVWGGLLGSTGAVAAALVVAVACGTPYGEKVAPDAGVAEEPGVEAAAPVDPCEHVSPVGPPTVDDDPATEIPPFILAFSTIAIDGPSLGFDLDNVCSCDTRPHTTFDGGQSCTRKTPGCDRDGGIDNAFSDVMASYAVFGSFEDLTKIKGRATQGRQTMLVYLRRYNGRANDRDVEVGVISSDGVRTAGCPGSEVGGDGSYEPKWCGDDAWSFRPEGSLEDGTPNSLANGYVRDYRLVVTLSSTARMGLGPVSLELSAAGVTGKLVPLAEDMTPRPLDRPPTEREKRLFKMEEGQLTGRLVAGTLLGAIGSISSPGVSNPAPSDHLCTSALFVQVRKEVCDALDVMRAPTLDFQSVPCDALSTAIAFEAMPAVLGGSFTATHDDNDCLPVDGKPIKPTKYAPSYECPGADGGF